MNKHAAKWTIQRQYEDEIMAGKAQPWRGRHAAQDKSAKMDTNTFLDWASGDITRTRAFYNRS